MKGYKVVKTTIKGKILSAITETGSIEYKKDQWVWPETDCGPLAVFRTFKEAEGFAGCGLGIWGCEYRPSKEKDLYYVYGYFNTSVRKMDHQCLPLGTILAAAVKITRCISRGIYHI